MSDAFKQYGFLMHEETPAELDARVLGYEVSQGRFIVPNQVKVFQGTTGFKVACAETEGEWSRR